MSAGASRGARRTAWFHCFAGISGDMVVAALLDAGADEGALREALATLPLPGWSLEVSRVLRGGLSAARVTVSAPPAGPARRLADLLEIVEGGELPGRAAARSRAAFVRLAEVESRLHGVRPDEVHLHELGGHDTVVDVVAAMVGLELLGVDEVVASPVATGSGTTGGAHGTIPNPAPASLALLEGAPVYGRDVAVELTTPTGAAILVAAGARFGPLPPLLLGSVGYGAGAREIDGLPNVLQVVTGALVPADDVGVGTRSAQPLVLVEANVDDATGEELADALAALLDAGAADAWISPVLMKKGRPGSVVSALADLALESRVRDVLLGHTGSFGARSHLVERHASSRTLEQVEVEGTSVRVKVSRGRAKVEHDDAAALALRLGVPVREVVRRAERAYADGRVATPPEPSAGDLHGDRVGRDGPSGDGRDDG
ncbi:MAG: nickel pincer cofactor biosynthesis protein LarC [Actinomycetota bacterium]|nr:nickel pincer cofactor biosynthesis protein LarC [Actinomycetota bacterium]